MNIELSTDTWVWIVSIIFGCVAFLWVVLLIPEEQLVPAGAGGLASLSGEKKGLFLRIFGPLIMALAPLMASLPLGERRNKLRRRLIQAGTPGGLTVDEFHAARIVGIVLLALIGTYFDLELGASPLGTITLAMLGLVYPDLWLTGLIETRLRRIFRDLPDTLDLLRLAVDAGLDLTSAMKVVVERGRKGPLLDELEKVEREMALGRTRKEAFRNFADRLATAEINVFVLALIQADQLGASIGPLLKVQSSVARTRRWQLAETLVNKMPMKLLGPLVLFIFPSSFIILFTPLIIQYMQGGV